MCNSICEDSQHAPTQSSQNADRALRSFHLLALPTQPEDVYISKFLSDPPPSLMKMQTAMASDTATWTSLSNYLNQALTPSHLRSKGSATTILWGIKPLFLPIILYYCPFPTSSYSAVANRPNEADRPLSTTAV